MTAAELKAATSRPSGLRAEVLAMWQEARGDWAGAHATVQDLETPVAAWVHAYLHRREGDQQNARYWYTRADRPVAKTSLDEEWLSIVDELLAT
jgi:hypothetical protein